MRSACVVVAERDQVMHALFAHVAERHQRAGWVLGDRNVFRSSTQAKARSPSSNRNRSHRTPTIRRSHNLDSRDRLCSHNRDTRQLDSRRSPGQHSLYRRSLDSRSLRSPWRVVHLLQECRRFPCRKRRTSPS
jgi:hypothetical protein